MNLTRLSRKVRPGGVSEVKRNIPPMKSIAAGISGSTRLALLSSAALLGLSLPTALMAQEVVEEEALPAPDAPEEALVEEGNEIIVTATKREQTLQQIPVAVSVTTAETIERAQIRDLKDLTSLVPSLRVTPLQSSANTNFIIRGFGNGANNAGIEPSVGVFVDGGYRSRSAAAIGDLPDIQRVEVLRGPQSTLFGKNASAGVISLITKAPSFKFGVNVEASYGNYDAIVVKGSVTGPLSDSVAASFAAGINQRDGYIHDASTGSDVNERNRWFLRGQLLFEPSDQWKIRLIGDYDKIDEVCCAVVNLRASGATQIIQALGGNVNPASDPFGGVVYNNFDSTNKIENYGLSGQIDYEFGPLTFTSITAYRRSNARTNQDSDFTSADLLSENSADVRLKTFTQELRLSTNLDGPFNVLLGGFYFNEKVDQDNQILFGTQFRPYADQLVRTASGNVLSVALLEGTFGALQGLPTKYLGSFGRSGDGMTERYSLQDQSYSIFGQVDFQIADGMTFTGGLNYTKDKKRFTADVTSTDAFAAVDLDALAYAPFRYQLLYGGALQGGATAVQADAYATANMNNPAANPLGALRDYQFLPPFVNVPNGTETGRTSDGDLAWTARLAYDVSATTNVYASYSTGFKASSVNLSRDSRPNRRFAGPEESTVYELGLKANWGVASVNVAAFKQSISGFQSNVFTGTGFALANAGKQSTWGFEFEGMVRPVDPLTLTMAVTWLDPKYDDFCCSALGDATGQTPAGIPALSATWGAQYKAELSNGDQIILRGDFHYEAPVQIVEGLPDFIVRDTAGDVVSYQPALDAARPFRREVNDLNASLTYAMANGLELSVWGRNLLDNRYLLAIFDSVAQSGSISGYPNQPKTYGVSARFKF